MKQIQKKTSLQEALLRFRSELSGSNLTAQQRISLMEDFKYWFERTGGDFDLAFNRISDKIMPDMERVKNMKLPNFKNYWKLNKAEVRKLFGFKTADSEIRASIKEGFVSGLREVDVINALLINAMEHFKRPLTQPEIDKIRYSVISEKVRLNEQGVKIRG